MTDTWKEPDFSALLELSREELAARLFIAGVVAKASLDVWTAIPENRLMRLRDGISGRTPQMKSLVDSARLGKETETEK